MKALVVRQPWAGLIACGEKNIENRTWQTSYRGPLAICAAKKLDTSPAEARKLFDDFGVKQTGTGVLVCVVDLLGIVEDDGDSFSGDLPDSVTSLNDDWFSGPYGWVLANPRPVKPMPVTGRLGLFEIPDNLVTMI